MDNQRRQVIFPQKGLQSFGMRLCISSLAHPFDYAKVLIQIGHEPFQPFPTRTLLGKPVYGLPNVFRYIQYIKSVDGVSGCFRGLGPKLCGTVLGNSAALWAKQFFVTPHGLDPDEDIVSDEEQTDMLKSNLVRDLVVRSVSVVVSQPFIVVSTRMMAQFVGGEEQYGGFFSSVREVYRTDGLTGFFSGFIPRLIGDIANLLLVNIATYAINRYIIEDRELRLFTFPSVQFIVNGIIYPFTVVSTCMAVNNCGLAAGMPPYMPSYKSWTHCWADLSQARQLNRGSSLFLRYYTGSKIVLGDGSVRLLPRL